MNKIIFTVLLVSAFVLQWYLFGFDSFVISTFIATLLIGTPELYA